MSTPDIDIEQAPVEWFEPREGFTFRPATIAVTHDHQAGKLSLCGLPADAFGDTVDPSFFIAIGIRAGIANGISAQGNVNMLQRLVQHRPARLGEPLRVRGMIDRVTEVPRGRTVHTDVWFEDAAGERVISAPRTSLKPDPDKAGSRGAGERPPPVVEDVDALEQISTHTLTPEIVKGYSSEGNSIHYEMEAANKAGFRAPLIGGGWACTICSPRCGSTVRRSGSISTSTSAGRSSGTTPFRWPSTRWATAGAPWRWLKTARC